MTKKTGSFVNAYVMSQMKIADKGKRFPLRAIMSTVWGEGADSLLFFPLAFYGVQPNNELPLMMLSQLILKTVYEIIVLPVTKRVVRRVKRHEGEDTICNFAVKSEFTKLSGEQSQVYLSYAMTMSKSRKSEFTCPKTRIS